MKEESVQCPECKAVIQDYEIRQILSEEEQEELEKGIQLLLLRNNSRLTKCTCGEIMEIVQGKLDLNYKDELGNVISK